MEPFATLTVDRGDRPQFFDFCMHQISRFTVQPKHTIIVNEPPTSEAIDITKRMKMGITAAKGLGIDIVYIIESDDYYSASYIEEMWIGDQDFIGCSKSLYYNLQNKTYNEFPHPNRSSLFCTAFRISALENFPWPPENTTFLDLILWQYANRYPQKKILLLDRSIGVGIKHGIGKRAGTGHRLTMPHKDSADMNFLKSKVDGEAMIFYRSL